MSFGAGLSLRRGRRSSRAQVVAPCFSSKSLCWSVPVSSQPPAGATSFGGRCFRSVAQTRLKVCQRLPSGFWSLPRRNASFSHQAAKCRLTGWPACCSCRAWGKSRALPIDRCSLRNWSSSACTSGCIGTVQVRRTLSCSARHPIITFARSTSSQRRFRIALTRRVQAQIGVGLFRQPTPTRRRAAAVFFSVSILLHLKALSG